MYLLIKRALSTTDEKCMYTGGGSILVGSMNGGPKMQLVHCPRRTGTSKWTEGRAASVIAKALEKALNKNMSVMGVLRRVSKTRYGKKHGMEGKPNYLFHADDLCYLKSQLQISGKKILVMVRIMRNRHHIVFGQGSQPTHCCSCRKSESDRILQG